MEERFTVAGVIRAHAATRPDAEMLVCGAERRTWSEQLRRSGRVAHALSRLGIGAGDRVAFLDRNGLAYFDLLFGGALLGAVDVAVNWRLAPPEIEAVLNDSRAAVLVVHPDYGTALERMATGLPSVRSIVWLGEEPLRDARGREFEDWIAGESEDDPGHRGDWQDVSLQLYTSGTTGLPKGVMLSNANMATSMSRAGETFRVDETTVSLVGMPLFHIGGSGWALAGMSRGGRSVILRDVDAAEILRLFEAEGVTETFLVPAVLMLLLREPSIATRDLSRLRNMFYGASPIADDVLVECMRRFPCQFTQVYGMTETTGAITALRPEDHDPTGPRRHLLRSAGRPFEDVELRVISPETGLPAETGAIGEVETRSAFNMVGYWDRPDETARIVDPDGWLRTGDAGYLDGEGYLFLYDRIKDMVVSGAENIYPAEVENVLLAHPAVVDAAVIGVPDDTWGEAVKAVVVLGEDATAEAVTADALIGFCHQHLAGYKCPKTVDFVAILPRNPSGKILKRDLRAPYWEGRQRNIN